MNGMLATKRMAVCTLFAAVGFVLISLTRLHGQGSQGNDAVYNSTATIVGSPAFIDASMYLPPNSRTQGLDICDAINGILSNRFGATYPAAGAVIDARGVSGAANLTCTHGSPWTEGSTTVTLPSTILLPAGTIVIQSTWVLPNGTHLIGEGDALDSVVPLVLAPVGTIIQAKSDFFNNNTDMIDLGSSMVCPVVGGVAICNSVSVEHLILDGQGQSINGIVNANARAGPTRRIFQSQAPGNEVL